MKAVRTWKRDQSQNLMDLEAAAANLKSRCVEERVREMTIPQIETCLMCGEKLQTRHAVFHLPE